MRDAKLTSFTASLFYSRLFPLLPRSLHIAHIVMLILLTLFIFTPLSCIAHERLDPVPCSVNCRLAHRNRLHFLITEFVADKSHPLVQCPHTADILPRYFWQLQKVYLKILGQPVHACLVIEPIHMVESR